MKCKYKFKVDAEIRPRTNAPISARGYMWEFLLHDGIVTHLVVTTPLSDKSQWPVITKLIAGPIKANVDPNLVHLPFLQHELRSIQGLLCIFGLRSIDPSDVEVEWIPESEEERAELKMHSFSITTGKAHSSQIEEMSFDLLARAVLAGPVPADSEVPLNFFRRARQAMYEREYIQAIYNFFFVIETLFGDGKHKKAALVDQLGKSETLCIAIHEELKAGPQLSRNEMHLQKQFDLKFKGKPVQEYIEHIVELRGYLHHHTLKRKGIWDANRQHEFQLDCILLSGITFRVLFNIAWTHMDRPAILKEYKRQISEFLGAELK